MAFLFFRLFCWCHGTANLLWLASMLWLKQSLKCKAFSWQSMFSKLNHYHLHFLYSMGGGLLLFFEVILALEKLRYILGGRDSKSPTKFEPCCWFLLLNCSLYWNFAWVQCNQSHWISYLKMSVGKFSMQKHEVLPMQGRTLQCFPKPGPQRRWWWARRKHRMWSLLTSNSVLLSRYIYLLELLWFYDGNVGLSA